MSAPAIETHETYSKTTLGSGIRVISSRMPHTQSASICVFVGTGSRSEQAEQGGISHFIEHMVFKGTKRRPEPKDISGPIEGVGGILNAETDYEYTCYWCKVPLSYFEESLDLLVDMLRNSAFAEDEIEKERPVIEEELRMIADHPDYRVEVLTNRTLWKDHPLGREVGGTKETVNSISRRQMLEYMETNYPASSIVLSVAGNVEHERVVELADKLFSNWRQGVSSIPEKFVEPQTKSQVQFEHRDTEQVNLAFALYGLPADHPDRYALDLFNVVLGEGMSSRLFLEIRERLGLAYEVHSSSTHFRDCGMFVVNAGVQPKQVERAVKAIVSQIVRAKEGITEEELEKARRLSAGRMMLRMEDSRAVAYWFGAQEVLLNRIKETEDVVRDLAAVSIGDVHRVVNDLLRTERLNLIMVGPARPTRHLRHVLNL